MVLVVFLLFALAMLIMGVVKGDGLFYIRAAIFLVGAGFWYLHFYFITHILFNLFTFLNV